ncbi:hypothetical protein OZX72_02940 [Bifidobacterium sp. ESL0769]|uniref:hypothetical protein n=1 Tax=Bifidobacterium sp. ESL0769 TaxID=2983229 RepID=UPI0023F9044A|nr:hypothetical protein [Bifidobacterium sp. ESL0769]WEV67955.1 hypothetical protein OZX72_02940 [Bifidobacterium sp. ESL0769]
MEIWNKVIQWWSENSSWAPGAATAVIAFLALLFGEGVLRKHHDARDSELPQTVDPNPTSSAIPQEQQPPLQVKEEKPEPKADWKISIDEPGKRFVLVNIGSKTAHNVIVLATAEEYNKKWPIDRSNIPTVLMNYSENLDDSDFFDGKLPKLREGTPFFDGHWEGDDNPADYHMTFEVLWDGGDKTMDVLVN